MDLQPGQNISISKLSPGANSVEVALNWEPASTSLEIDTSAFALNAQGKVRGDEDFVFYNQPTLSGGGIQRSADGKLFTFHLPQLPSAIEKVALALTIHQGRQRSQSFSQLQRVTVDLRDGGSKSIIATFPLPTAGMAETAVIAGEIYRRNNEWKFRAVGQGFVGGLGPLASNYGVDVGDDPDNEASSPQPVPPPAESAPKPAAVPPPATPVRLEKITLEKKGQKISLEKSGQGFERIVVNLNWNQQQQSVSGGGGFLGRMLGSSKGIDLDLGCLFQLNKQIDGQWIAGAVQALGDSFGSFQQPPFIQLLGDDRTGTSAEGEFLHINGAHWEQIRRVLIFAFIYEGVPNWAAADAVVTIATPNQPTLEVRLDSHRNDQGMCAIALLENKGGNIEVSKLVEYFPNHQVLDQRYGFGLRWVAGSKS